MGCYNLGLPFSFAYGSGTALCPLFRVLRCKLIAPVSFCVCVCMSMHAVRPEGAVRLMATLRRAIQEGHEGVVLQLLDADPELLESRDYLDDTPLIVAARLGHLEIVKLLVERGAESNATGFGAKSALHCAATNGYEEIVAFLLSQGAEVHARQRQGWTPLMCASSWGHVGVVRRLLTHMGGEGLNQRAADDKTALHHAAARGKGEVVRLLLLCGADPSLMDNEGRTPRALAEGTEDSIWAGASAVFTVSTSD